MNKINCAECGAAMVLRFSAKYNSKFYGCSNYPTCTGTHGAHQSTGKPLGIPATRETKQWRIKAHNAFDYFWKMGVMKRKEAYKKLAALLGVDRIHMAESNIETCKKIICICTRGL